MANFLITSPNEKTEGTTSNDTFVVRTAGLLGATIYGNDGGDLISAAASADGTNVILNGMQGNDTITLAAGPGTNLGRIYGGGGDDIVSAADTVDYTKSTIHGGQGADTLTIASGFVQGSTVNGNAGNDLISAGRLDFSASLIALGGGNDTLTIDSAEVTTATIAAGGGNDLITATTISAANLLRIEGDTIGDTEFYGNDTIHVNDGTLGNSALVQGGGGADHILISANYSGGTTINGNAGKDSINLAGGFRTGMGLLIGGGAGNDTIQISASLITGNTDTIFGGGGADIIDLQSATITGAGLEIQGGAGADTIGLGATTASGMTSVNIRYTAFSDSNLAGIDLVSAGQNESAFVISQTVVSGSTAASLNAGGADGLSTDAAGLVTFGANVATNLTARAAVIDKYATEGQIASFTDGSGNNYIFMQGGATNSGTDNDLIIQTTTQVTGFGIAGGTAVAISM